MKQKAKSKKQYIKPASKGSAVQLYSKKAPMFEMLLAVQTE
ncbi:MAG: hypothetical protein WAV30_01450 [Microgenomates group bacterium]